jgi:hypothetical protein
MDVQRYLADEAVQACPPSASYRIRKFVRRYKRPVLAACLLIVALFGGIIGTTWGMLRATDAEVVAVNETKQKETALLESQQSEREKSVQLWRALVAQARANRLSRRAGQRFESLETLKRATQLARALKLPAENFHELRNAVIATLAVPDLHLTGPSNPYPADRVGFDFDEAHAIYARTDRAGNCSIRRVADDTETHRLAMPGGPCMPSLSRDGRFVAVHHWPKALDVWKLDELPARRIFSQQDVQLFDFRRDSQQVAVAYNNSAIALFELPSGLLKSRLQPAPPVTHQIVIALHPTEPVVTVTSYDGPVVQVRDVQTGKVLASLPQPARPLSVAWHPDGRTLAIGYESHHIRLYDRTSWQEYRTLEAGTDVTSIEFDRAGERLAIVGVGRASWNCSMSAPVKN